MFYHCSAQVIGTSHLHPWRLGVGICCIDASDGCHVGPPCILKLNLHGLVRDRMPRQGEVGNRHGQQIPSRTHQLSDGGVIALSRQDFGSKAMQHFEGTVSRFGDAVKVHQAETTMKGQGWKTILVENIRKGSVAVALNQPSGLHSSPWTPRSRRKVTPVGLSEMFAVSTPSIPTRRRRWHIRCLLTRICSASVGGAAARDVEHGGRGERAFLRGDP